MRKPKGSDPAKWAKYWAAKRREKREREQRKQSMQSVLKGCGPLSPEQRAEAKAEITALDECARREILKVLALPTGERKKRKS